MSSLLNIKEFKNRFVIEPVAKMAGGFKKIHPEVFFLPENSLIHFIPETTTELGVDKSFSLLKNHYSDIVTSHVTELYSQTGHPDKARVSSQTLKLSYHRTHLTVKEVTNLDRTLSINQNPVVLNYSLLYHLYTYKGKGLSNYYEWLNVRNTMWENISQIGTRRNHFIRFKLPRTLPSRSDLNKHLKSFNASGLDVFFEKDSFDLLELWQIIHPGVETPISKIDESVLENVYISFIESGIIATICLGDLIYWSLENEEATINAFYKFLDSLIAIRSPADLKQLESDVEDIPDTTEVDYNSKIVKLVNDHGQAGNISNREQKALLTLSNKYKTTLDPHGSGVTLDKMVTTPENIKFEKDNLVNDHYGVISDQMNLSSVKEKEAHYIEKNMPTHIIQNVLKLQDGGIIVKDIKCREVVDAASRVREYSVQTIPVAGEQSTFKFTVPIIDKNGTFLLGGTKYRLDTQNGEMPIVKTKPNTVALTSYYGKLFIVRSESASLNFGRWFFKLLSAEKHPNVTDVIFGINRVLSKVPRCYSAIAENFTSFTISNQYQFTFNQSKIETLFTSQEIEALSLNKLIACGRDTKTKNPLGMDIEGKIYLIIPNVKTENVIYLGTIPNLISEDLRNGPIEYTEVGIFSKRAPIVLLLMYMNGLDGMLKALHINYRLEPINVRIPYNEKEYLLKCKDVVYAIDISNPFIKLLIGGLYPLRDVSTRYKSSDFNTSQSYGSIFSVLGLSSQVGKEIGLMWDMFVDPITESILKMYNLPFTFEKLIIHASDMLIDDHIDDITTTRFKGYERVCGMIYRELVLGMREHRSKSSSVGTTFSINPNAVLMSIQQDQTQSLVEESNPIHNLKEKESVTYAGAGGRNIDTMVKDSRGFGKDDFGVVSEATPDSGKVGYRAYLAPDANITTSLGTIERVPLDTKNPTKVLSTSALLSPGITHDDAKRINHIGIQNSHTVACDNYDALPYRTAMEETLAGRVDDIFAVSAEEDGEVLSVSKDTLKIKYKGGKTKNYEIGIYHGVVSGTTIPHNRITDLRPGDKFKAKDILIFDSGFFQRAEMNKNNVIYKHGVLTRVAFLDNAFTNEDGVVISKALADKFYTPKTEVRSLIIDFDTVIHNLVEVGIDVTPETILCTLEGFVSEDLVAKDAKAIEALTKISANSPKANCYGNITNIEVLYFGKIEDMHGSLGKIAIKYDNIRNKKVSTFETNHAKTGKINESIRVNGIKLEQNQMAIKIYIDSLLDMNCGDKIVVCHQLKSTVSHVDTNPMVSEDGKEVDAVFGVTSVSARIVDSVKIVGMMTEILTVATLEVFVNSYYS